MWELVILRLIRENGFQEILSVDDVRTRRKREQFFEMRGRGCWHQIDCPCEYDKFIAFINPIRLLGEVKYYSRPITKDHIRASFKKIVMPEMFYPVSMLFKQLEPGFRPEPCRNEKFSDFCKRLIRQFVGILKDIQENYFTSDVDNQPSERYTELGAFFSSSGFDKEAVKLAFAHNIKTISHKNVWILEPLKRVLEDLENNYLLARVCVSAGSQSDFVRAFKRCLEGDVRAIRYFIRRFLPADGINEVMNRLVDSFRAINCSFVATTSGGALLHFVGEQDFPEYLFQDTDRQLTRVFYFRNNSVQYFYLEFAADQHRRKYYFNPPMALDQAAFYGQREAVYQKRQLFRSIHVTRQISGLSRNLVLELDQDWLDQVEARL